MEMGLQPSYWVHIALKQGYEIKAFFIFYGDGFIALNHGYRLIASFFFNGDGLVSLKHGDEFLAFFFYFIYIFFKEDGFIAFI